MPTICPTTPTLMFVLNPCILITCTSKTKYIFLSLLCLKASILSFCGRVISCQCTVKCTYSYALYILAISNSIIFKSLQNFTSILFSYIFITNSLAYIPPFRQQLMHVRGELSFGNCVLKLLRSLSFWSSLKQPRNCPNVWFPAKECHCFRINYAVEKKISII